MLQNQVFGLQTNSGAFDSPFSGAATGSFADNLATSFGGDATMSNYMAMASAPSANSVNDNGGTGSNVSANDLANNMMAITNMMNVSKMANLPMMPLAGKLFETIEAVQNNFAKKYDMKMQKEISKIQVKLVL